MKQALVILVSWLLFVTACDPCAECGEPLVYDPVVNVKFINRDSVVTLTSINSGYADSLDSISRAVGIFEDSIGHLEDSLIVVDSLVLAGETEFIAVQSTFNDIIFALNSQVIRYDSISDELDSIVTELNKVISTINAGTIQIQSANISENGTSVSFEDSMSSFALPLLLENNLTQTTYTLVIDGHSYQIGFTYETFESVDKARVARVEAGNIDTLFHTFDSLSIECSTPDCISNEAVFTAYF